MPLFECSQCHTVENTACCNYWVRVHLEKEPPLCSECDPDIGKWHGLFPRATVTEYNAKNPASPVEYPLESAAGKGGRVKT